MPFLKIVIFSLALVFGISANGQRRNTPNPRPVAKYRPPKLTTSIGNYKDTMFIPVQEAANVMGLPLKITDAKNDVFTVSSYNFVYRQIVTTEDDSLSGKPSYTTSIKSSLFKTTPLPALWLSVIKERPLPGEEYIFFDVIARDDRGRVMYAPNIKLTLK